MDPWSLTDPSRLQRWQQDRRARQAIDALWAGDPDPGRTLTVHAQIRTALESDAIARATGSDNGTHFYCRPWSPIYQVRRPREDQRQALDGAAAVHLRQSLREELAEGGQFVRRILLGPFQPTSEVDYCDPSTGHHDD